MRRHALLVPLTACHAGSRADDGGPISDASVPRWTLVVVACDHVLRLRANP